MCGLLGLYSSQGYPITVGRSHKALFAEE